MAQIRVSIPDELLQGMEHYSSITRSELIVIALRALVGADLPQPERDIRFNAMVTGRFQVRILTLEEMREAEADQARKNAEVEAAKQVKLAEFKEKARAAAAARGLKLDGTPLNPPEQQPSAKPVVMRDPTGLETLPPMAVPTGGDDPLGMSSPQIAPGEGRRDHA